MASTVKVTDTANWILPFLRYAPVAIGTNNEPVLSSANFIKQIIMSPPLIWRWNRNVKTFSTVANQQDSAAVTITDFGFLEKAVVIDSNGIVMELTDKDLISDVGTSAEADRPTFIAVQTDDNANNYVFRFSPVPDAIYTIKLIYQMKPTLITSAAYGAATASWAPIPDEYGYIYQAGLLSLMMAANDDERFQIYWSRFVSSLMGTAQGLTELQKVLFIGNMLDFSTQVTAAQIGAQGKQGRLKD